MIINRKELKKALEIVKPGLANKDVIEQASSFAFMKNRVVTYNDEISISYPVKELQIQGAIRAEELYQLLNKLDKDEIEIETTKKEIIIEVGKTKAGLTLQREITLPLEEIGETGKWKDLPEDFVEGLRFAVGNCGTDMSKPVLTCVHSHDSFVESSDGFGISRFSLCAKLPIYPFLIPANSIVEIIKMNPYLVAEGEGWVHFKAESGAVLSCRVFEDSYPDIEKHLKTKGKNITLPRGIADILDRVTVFSKRDHFLDETVTVELSKNRIRLKGKSGSGWIEEEANMKYAEDPVAFFVTPSLICSILQQSHNCILGSKKLRFEGENWEYVALLKNKPEVPEIEDTIVEDDLPF